MNRVEFINQVFEQARAAGMVKTRTDFADMLELNRSTLSAAMNGNEKYLTKSLENRIRQFWDANFDGKGLPIQRGTLPVIPTEAMAGTLGEFAASIQGYECERMISPIKGVDYAIKVCGDSMTPEIPNGSQILIKKIYEEEFIEWGKIFCLDTRNGAVIKRVYPTDDPEEIECRSINPDYPPFRIKCKCINGWYRVMMVLALK